MSRPPLPPFTEETAREKVRLAEDGWNSRDPAKVALAYTEDTIWRNRVEFPRGRAEAEAFLTRKWAKELDYRLIKINVDRSPELAELFQVRSIPTMILFANGKIANRFTGITPGQALARAIIAVLKD